MLNFTVDIEKCISCGQCASDCPAMIIAMVDNLPIIPKELEQYCIGCMHCVAVCSEGAAAILGYLPENGQEYSAENLPQPAAMERLIKGRRSIRNYQDRNVDRGLIEKLLEVASHSPSGHNNRGILYTLIDDKGVLFDLREEAFTALESLVAEGALPDGMEMFADILEAWKSSGKDILFRGAPHLLIASASDENASPLHDCMIALTTFELYANSCGLGTIWNGLALLTLAELVPALREKLGIPKEHTLGYAMGFGLPALNYKRTIERGMPTVNRITALEQH
jgi:nitroreductase/NAD-dependent dihydropyrimidine dehydrogenase PreA subunit